MYYCTIDYFVVVRVIDPVINDRIFTALGQLRSELNGNSLTFWPFLGLSHTLLHNLVLVSSDGDGLNVLTDWISRFRRRRQDNNIVMGTFTFCARTKFHNDRN